MMLATPIQQGWDPAKAAEHRFGLPPERWRALSGCAVWITGAGTGYGRSLAAALAAAGAQIFLSGRRPEKLEEALAYLRGLPAPTEHCVALPCDIRDAASVAAAAETIRRTAGALYGVINNAALPQAGMPDPLARYEPGQWQAIFDTNVTGQWLVTRAALPLLLAGPAARVLFMTSEAGWAFTPGFGPYNVSKAALNNLGASFAAECAAVHPGRDIQVNVLVPGEARTEMNQGSPHSPNKVVPMALALLSHPAGGPNGHFFHRDGRHLAFAYAPAYGRSLL